VCRVLDPEKQAVNMALKLDSITISWIFLPGFLKKKEGKVNNYRYHERGSTVISFK
jgi:hypothetical protein